MENAQAVEVREDPAALFTNNGDGVPEIEVVQFLGLEREGVKVRLMYDNGVDTTVVMQPDDLASVETLEAATCSRLAWEAYEQLRSGVIPNIPLRLFRRFSAETLAGIEFPPAEFIIEDILPEGLAVLAGKPKVGKSWWAMSNAIDVAANIGAVLYLALEDPPRRLQSRMRTLLNGSAPPSRLEFRTEWPKLHQGGIDEMEHWLKEHEESAKMIVVDTIARVRPSRKDGEDMYLADYGVWGPLQSLTVTHPGVAILGVHHQRKTASDDALDTVLGSQGVTGVADTILILRKSRGKADGELYVTGRDVEESERALRFESGHWRDIGDAADFRMSEERDELVNLLTVEGPQTIAEVARSLGKKYDTARMLLRRALDDGRVEKRADGKYEIGVR